MTSRIDISFPKKALKYANYIKNFHQQVFEKLSEFNTSQFNDFTLVKIPNNFPNGGNFISVDYKLVELVKFMWKNEIVTISTDQGFNFDQSNKILLATHIMFNKKTLNGKSSIKVLNKLLDNKVQIKKIDLELLGPKEFKSYFGIYIPK